MLREIAQILRKKLHSAKILFFIYQYFIIYVVFNIPIFSDFYENLKLLTLTKFLSFSFTNICVFLRKSKINYKKYWNIDKIVDWSRLTGIY